MRTWASGVALLVVVAGSGAAAADEAALAPSGFEAVDTHGPIFVAPDGALVKRVPGAPSSGTRPRVMTPGGVASTPAEYTALELSAEPAVTLWVQTVDLERVVVAETWLAPDPKAAPPSPGAPGVWLLPGAHVAVLRRVDEIAEVDYRDAALSLRGWIPAAALGKTYVAGATPATPAAGRKLVQLPDPAILATAPGGAPVAAVRGGAPVTRLGAKQDGQVLVERADRFVRVVGWIADRELRAPPLKSQRITVFGNADPSLRVIPVDVAPGTPVLDRPGGNVIGRYRVRHRLYPIEQRDGHAMLQLLTAVGAIEVWVALPAAAPTPR